MTHCDRCVGKERCIELADLRHHGHGRPSFFELPSGVECLIVAFLGTIKSGAIVFVCFTLNVPPRCILTGTQRVAVELGTNVKHETNSTACHAYV